MTGSKQRSDRKAIWLLSGLGGFVGALCCLPPIVLVLFGLAGVSAANSLGNRLYGEYAWWFRLVALVFLVIGLVLYFRRQGICSIDEARRQRRRVINVALLSIFSACGMYVFWNYVVLHYWGIAVGLPWAQWDESWAIPTSAALLALAAAAVYLVRTARE
jgi:fumarate reductase subunit D